MNTDPHEPLIHSHITDCLPDDHPLARTNVHCVACSRLVHAFNNETMTTWVESGLGAFCLQCFASQSTGDDGAHWLPGDPETRDDLLEAAVSRTTSHSVGTA